MEPDIRHLHFIGIGGIGMSALAQMSAALGIRTTGSDRAAASPENARIFDALRSCGITIYPQDGSIYKDCTPDAVVYSTAIENDNPEFICAPPEMKRLHRSDALKFLVESVQTKNMIAVAGTCGKTSVSAQLAEALFHLNSDPGVLCGGLVNAFVSDRLAGNFRKGGGEFFVVEADESDKSLLHYTPDTALILNIGTDHYSKEELAEVFRKFMFSARKRIVVADSVLEAAGADAGAGKDTLVFSGDPDAPSTLHGFPVIRLDHYRADQNGAFCSFDGQREIPLRAPGFHNALNALAVYCVLIQAGFKPDAACQAVAAFSGVWRRFDYAGTMENGAKIYDDYAHNPEKILSCFDAAKSVSSGRVFLLFQPHGFKPFGDMKDVLLRQLKAALRPRDVFALLPVYYAGGTSSFRPSSESVIEEWHSDPSVGRDQFRYFPDRETADLFLKNTAKKGESVVIMGARDNSLSIWAKKNVKKT